MKTYILCPYYKTGGPYNMHQLCNLLNEMGCEAYLYYIPNSNPIPLYPLPHIKLATSIPDDPKNILIIPEIYSVKQIQHSLPNTTIIVWWLSYTNAALFNTLQENTHLSSPSIHFFHSYFEYANIRPFLPPRTMWFYLSDFVDIPSLNPPQQELNLERENAVAYNHAKDKITPYYCSLLNIPAIPIKDMSPLQVVQTLSRVKIYADLGFHPGKDRLPREAALCNCVVVTNKAGAAAYQEDLPIQEKITHEEDLLLLLPQILSNYPLFLQKQEPYRTKIKNEKEIFHRQVSQIWNQLYGIISPGMAVPSGMVV